ncbi:hypothetical protein KY284_020247 [Solanum tuberosum]|nr:hypothetical protein KY284_020247 [Solanum tuberosum]
MQAKRVQELCYFCNEKYNIGHKCNLPKQLFMLEMDSIELEDLELELKSPINDNKYVKSETIVYGATTLISLCALVGIQGAQTIHVKGYSGKRPVQILLDGGITHNSIDKDCVKRLGCTVIPTPTSYVSFGNTAKETTTGVVRDFEWILQGTTYLSDLIVFPIGRYDIVLGALWMKTLGPMTIDFTELTISFNHQWKKHILKGVHEDCRLTSSKVVNKLSGDQVELFMLQMLQVMNGTLWDRILPCSYQRRKP